MGHALPSRLRHPRAAEIVLYAGLLVLALASLAQGFDIARLVTGDALYPVQMLESSPLHYRPPLANRLFPDIAMHAVVATVVADPLSQKLLAGTALFVLTALMIGLFKGLAVFCLYLLITISAGFGFLDSACHYSLPLTVLLYQLARGHRAAGAAVLGVVVFSNVLVLFPLVVLLTRPEERRWLRERLAVIAVAVAGAVAFAEFDATTAKFSVAFSAWLLALALADRFKATNRFLVAAIAGLTIAGALGLIYPRYALPVAASLVVAITPVVRPRLDFRFAAIPAAMLALFAATHERRHLDRTVASYDCLARTLEEREIATVATDHWTAKPLYYAKLRRNMAPSIAQTDFHDGDSLLWMASYTFYGQPTPWAVRNVDNCRAIREKPVHCAHATTAPIVSREPLCGMFELYRYETQVPVKYEPPPRHKLHALQRRIEGYSQAVLKVAGFSR